jgi:hypothetical protein
MEVVSGEKNFFITLVEWLKIIAATKLHGRSFEGNSEFGGNCDLGLGIWEGCAATARRTASPPASRRAEVGVGIRADYYKPSFSGL